MSRNSSYMSAAILSLFLAASFSSANATESPGANAAQASDASSQDKAKACNDAADKKGLKDEERRTFIQNCLKKMKR
jgi:sulfur relay (sulfurtransferase) complex TusBCD TusD component (DsrE family)